MIKRETYSATLTFEESKILLVKFKDGVEVDLDEMIQLVDVSLEMVNNSNFFLLVDARNILSSMNHKAREYITNHKEYNNLNIAQAIIVNNMPIKILANFYIKFYKQENPVKMFNNYDEGKTWLTLQVK